jgi:phenylalanyl-tRNA synthetase beta chain
VTPPAYRFDLEIEEDLVEEVIRITGYDNIGAMKPKMMLHPRSSKNSHSDMRKIRHTMSDLGYSELVSYSFIDEFMESILHGNDHIIKLENPIAENMNTMRSHLWSSHIDALKFNTNRGRTQIKFFEIANKFSQDNSNFSEEPVLSGLVSGEVIPKNWIEKNRAHDFYDVKSDLEQLLGDGITMKQSAKTIGAFHPGQSADIFRDNKKIGYLGKLHPSLQKQLDVDQELYLFEIGLNHLSENDFKLNTEILKSVPLQRDIAILVDEDVVAGDVVDVVRKRNINFIKDFRIFDVYQGQGIAEGKKSLAFLILMQDTYKTLEEKDVEKSVTEVINLLKKEFNAELRL